MGKVPKFDKPTLLKGADVRYATNQPAEAHAEIEGLLLDALLRGQVAAEKAGMLNGTSNWALCLLHHIRTALSAKEHRDD